MNNILLILFFLSIFLYFYIRYKKYKPKNLDSFIKNFNKLPKLASHRGYGKKGPIAENTLISFEKSTSLGFLFHEMDVRVSKDGVPIVFHGPTLSETTDGFGRLESYNFEILKNLNWGFYINKKTKIPILTLEDYLHKLQKKVVTNIELKKELIVFNRKLEKSVIALIKKLKAEKRVFFSSFNPLILLYLKKRAPEIPIGLLVEPGFFSNLICFFLRILILPDFIHPPVEMATEKKIKQWKKLNYGVIIWTVNDLKKAKELFNWGADIVITDNINMMKEYKKSIGRSHR
ncbi:MAG: glycerophosphodiester phosphodiesterase [Spirochaetia bacterium]|nr:glycerophosphodiester phosphodiesterase [Spirochaetia bacterium]